VGQSLHQERTKLARLQAEKEDINLKRLKGELVPADAVVEHWETMLLAFRAKIMGISPRAAMVALNATTLQDIEDSLDDFLREALHELAGDGMPDEYKTVRQNSPPSIKATNSTHREQMG